MTAPIFAPYIQLGFAGFAFLLVFVIVWLIRRLLNILDKTNQIIAGNTEAINRVHEASEDQKALMKDIRDQLFQRPCLLQNLHHDGSNHENRAEEII
jgi:F0F1-type ATP synthase membrane subunit b/b'